jgi:hypothetical protein
MVKCFEVLLWQMHYMRFAFCRGAYLRPQLYRANLQSEFARLICVVDLHAGDANMRLYKKKGDCYIHSKCFLFFFSLGVFTVVVINC